MFNKKTASLAIGLIIALASCKKYEEDSPDFSNKINDYIIFSPNQDGIVFNAETADTVIGTDTFYYYVPDEQSIAVETRVAFPEDIQFTYTVTTENGVSETHQGVLTKFTTAASVSISLVDLPFPDSADVMSGEIELISASGPTKGELVVGHPQPGIRTKISFVVNKPNVYHPY